ncbi:MAG: M12 family metallo-peptidase [Gelidibacter sp.]
MKTKLHYVFALTMVFFSFTVFGQKSKFVKISNETSIGQERSSANGIKTFDSYQFNEEQLRGELQSAPNIDTFTGRSNVTILFPSVNGKMEQYRVVESSVMHPDLQALYPEIRSYIGHSVNDSKTIYFSISPYKGLNAIILGDEVTTVYESYHDNVNKIKVFEKSSKVSMSTFECSTIAALQQDLETDGSTNRDADDSLLRTYRLAMSVTGEYSTLNGGTLPLVNAAIATTLTNVNAVFLNDFNVRMQLIPTNNNVIYLNGATDPYSGTSDANYNSALATTLNTQIGAANYDIGHLMAGIGNNGNAGCIGCVCSAGSYASGTHKGSGFTTSTVPYGINFDIDYVAHEMGHQFGANHTFTFSPEGGIAQMEPGSGTTIMGYAGITGATDVQPHSDPYFHSISIQQVTTYVKNNGTCSVNTSTGNTTPTVNAGSDITMPIGTAFKLTGAGTDANGDTITYCWEQFDENNGNTAYPDPSSTNSNTPLFRSYLPTTNPTRTFPKLSDIVAFGVNGSTWEKVPNVTRNADFRLTVRDNRSGGANNTHDDMRVNFSTAYGPFAITSQTTPNTLWTSGTSQTITWSVNNTTALAGSSNVNILLSTDGGVTFPTVLVANTPNDGSQAITVPNMPAPYCRIMIEPTGNQYFAINTANISIDYQVSTSCESFTVNPNFNIPDAGTSYSAIPIASTSTATFGADVYAKLSVNITHTYIGDLYLALQSPGGTFVALAQAPCGNFANLNVTFVDGAGGFTCANPTVGEVAPLQSLGAYSGETANGQWLFGVADAAAQDTGVVNSLTLDICTQTVTPLSVQENELTEFSIYPNPNNGEFTIKLNSGSNQDIKVQVYDIRGRMVFNNAYANTQTFNQTINLNAIQSGMYLVTVSDGEKQTTKKIIIE